MEKQWKEKHCQPCAGETRPMDREQAGAFLDKVPGWQLNDDATGISRQWVMKNFVAAVDFIGKIAAVAEEENHHPDIHLTGYRNLRVELSTHKIGGLSENDFILAAKINELPAETKE